MYFFSADTIVQANKNIETLDPKVGGLLCVLHCLVENIEENVSYTIDGERLRRQLSTVFDKEPKDTFDFAKPSYIIFARDWVTTFFENHIKTKIDLLSCAVFFLRRHGFEKECTNAEIIDIFVKIFNLENYKDRWFYNGNKVNVAYNQSFVEDNQAEFYIKMGYASDFKSVLFSGVIKKSAADLKAAGQIQTLYSGSNIHMSLLLSNEPLDKYYVMNNKSTEDTTQALDSVLNHNLYGIHIKEKNDALSDTTPHVCIGWSCLGDLTDVDSKETLGLRYDEHIKKEPRGRGQDIGQVWRFINDVQIGDYIIFADEGVCHIGRIESDYYFDDTENPNEDPDYANKRKVTWLKKNIARSSLSTAFHRSLMTAMSIWGLNDYKSSVVELLNGTYKKDIIDDLGEVQETEGVKMITFESNIDCDLPRNRILFGAPGTGKSHTLNKEVDELVSSANAEFERVTFHPDYSYANFVGTYKPVPKPSADGEDSITYKYVPGPFMRVLTKALINANTPTETPKPFILVIEEINRANVAAVFGEVFQLLDRDDENCSEYEIEASEDLIKHLSEKLHCSREAVEKLKIPSNMFIWATMNSADQGVFPMDTAFKRRWDFTYLGIDNGDENIAGKSVTLGKGDYKRVVEWNKLRKAINAVLSSKEFKINEDKLMGPYFLSTKVIPLEGEIDAQKFTDSFKSKVIMYLFEDAAKQKKHTLFSGCSDTTRYSSIRDEFDTKGVFIFCEEIHNQFPAPANGEGETE